ncbi:MAG: hypothetical protein SVU88_02365 [Candidatus Nanohaloarchaea archaeon]|nr:hypothetical protein [Candidatus Nanohaloarchaea archaeon]
MVEVEHLRHGSYETVTGEPGRYGRWKVRGRDLDAELQITQRGHRDPVTGVELRWVTPLERSTWRQVVEGDEWLGGNPDVRLYSDRSPREQPIETTYLSWRYDDAGPASPDAVELVNGEPPERYQVGWSRYDRDAAPDYRAELTFNPRIVDRHGDGTGIGDHLAGELEAATLHTSAVDVAAITEAMVERVQEQPLQLPGSR